MTPIESSSSEITPADTGTLLPGLQVRIGMGGERMLPAVIKEIREDRITLQFQDRDGSHRHLPAGSGLLILRSATDAAYIYRGSLESEDARGILNIRLTQRSPERLQRRQFFRMQVRFPLVIQIPTAEDEIPETEPGKPGNGSASPDSPPGAERPCGEGEVRVFRLLDLSGGGCLCEDPDHILREGRSYQASLQLCDQERCLSVEARIVRCSQGEAGICFVGLKERDRERILRSLFREYRRRRTLEIRRTT